MRIKSRIKLVQFLAQAMYYMVQTLINNRKIEGTPKYCNVCGWEGKSFYTFFNEMCRQKDPTLCPECASSVYQRALAQYLQDTFNPDYPFDILEVSPHSSDPAKVLNKTFYTSIDIVEGRAMQIMDLRHLSFKDNSFDIVVCSAVLEHIKEDVMALREMYRVLRPNGVAVIEIPIGYYRDMLGTRTIEFVGTPFYEHHRSYGFDFEDKMIDVGFKYRRIDYNDSRLGFESLSILGFYEGVK